MLMVDGTSPASESNSSALELYDGFDEFDGVSEVGWDGACDEGDGGGLEVGGLPVSFVWEAEVIHII